MKPSQVLVLLAFASVLMFLTFTHAHGDEALEEFMQDVQEQSLSKKGNLRAPCGMSFRCRRRRRYSKKKVRTNDQQIVIYG